MDIKLMLTTFGLVFLAELGDKTQLAAFCLSANCDSKVSVFLGEDQVSTFNKNLGTFVQSVPGTIKNQLPSLKKLAFPNADCRFRSGELNQSSKSKAESSRFKQNRSLKEGIS